MDIGGFQKTSLIDFPETIACIIFTQGCNFICPYCHNPDLVADPQKRVGNFYDETEIFRFLKKRQGFIEGVVITGGEPTLQTDLFFFCQKIKDMGYKLKLDSNGARPRVLENLIKNKLVDFISMDIKTNLENYHLVIPEKFDTANIVESTRILMDKAPAYEFRTTCTRPFVSKKIMDDIGKMISGAPKYILQKCSRKVSVLDPDFLSTDKNFFSDKEMIELQNTINKYVTASIIR
ncbi:MAG: anaerobic ribonucleoside-triphosphate reductase activating protein [Desulfobacula sp.]|uniref:anaerobic ribonucleoside-triphosphate reductase activating protein n=1 Tax=Desulfobacula sp. TaxID=2593537 RepID=UPI001E11E12C|nr:anaerobic ribonucleoside-triphosphate reductase activating protein [Desulfobacula sp.]MBT3487097.1 anaerobic ribonucleoside-triphosphate reductase activating protein [Desulfobacula sp.]MBT4024756.1 anaerobic ribonucleoside-triphosphate reductase activating protein [Desulfobacula sp.]MBT4200196.1 anaerobic ribonucleoside-triphosphate reductase activating protein [Desulfobacula sp.]MBT4508344.1 anaerobic ribonucleoside-triphosphate reductase activating protein [Desulfobacula sp.]